MKKQKKKQQSQSNPNKKSSQQEQPPTSKQQQSSNPKQRISFSRIVTSLMMSSIILILGLLFMTTMKSAKAATSPTTTSTSHTREQCDASDPTCNAPNDPQQQQQQNQQAPDESQPSSVWKIPKHPKQLARRAAKKGQLGFGTRIISNFINDAKVLEVLTDPELWYACYEHTRGSHTHWMDKDAPPKNLIEKLATELWKDQPILNNNKDYAGYEIWCNLLTPEGPLPWHIDKDQILYQQSGGQQLVVPLYGSVYYGYPHDFDGGYLEITSLDPSDPWPDNMEDVKVERISAEYNRLVIFNASQFHRVTPITNGTRVTLAVNVWKEKPQVAYFQEQQQEELRRQRQQ